MTTATLSAEAARAQLPPPFSTSAPASTPLDLIAQGAESLLFRTTFLDTHTPAALKVRPVKRWRHPILDRRLTRSRILSEARVLVRCRRDGVTVPAVLGLDWEGGWMAMEWIDGVMVKEGLRAWDRRALERARVDKKGQAVVGRETVDNSAITGTTAAAAENKSDVQRTESDDVAEQELLSLLANIGHGIAQLHLAGVIHGDLTTSNMMLRPAPRPTSSLSTTSPMETPQPPSDKAVTKSLEIVLIDFGLAQQSSSDEDRAVDLYVLERAFGSTHPRQEKFFEHILTAYGERMGKAGKVVLRRLEDVRMRGRKKSMVG